MFSYSSLSIVELIDKIEKSRFFNLPKMVAEALRNLKSSTDISIQNISNSVTNLQPDYKVYIALLTQTGTNPPVPMVLENTLGYDLEFIYDSVGNYYTELINNGEFFFSSAPPSSGFSTYTGFSVNDQFFIIDTGTILAGEPTPANNILSNTPIEIRVYN